MSLDSNSLAAPPQRPSSADWMNPTPRAALANHPEVRAHLFPVAIFADRLETQSAAPTEAGRSLVSGAGQRGRSGHFSGANRPAYPIANSCSTRAISTSNSAMISGSISRFSVGCHGSELAILLGIPRRGAGGLSSRSGRSATRWRWPGSWLWTLIRPTRGTLRRSSLGSLTSAWPISSKLRATAAAAEVIWRLFHSPDWQIQSRELPVPVGQERFPPSS
jgi:hypothetical protein